MKKTLLLTLLPVLMFSGCSEWNDGPEPGMIWDFTSYDLTVSVVDSQGRDLLNPNNPGAIDPESVEVEYNGEKYQAEPELLNWYAEGSRAYMPPWRGLRYGYSQNAGSSLLFFGEFGPEPGYKGKTFTIDWGDGTKDVVKFDLYVTWKKHKPTVNKAVYLNGKRQADPLLVRVVK